MKIPSISSISPHFRDEGYFAVIFTDNYYMEIPFYEILEHLVEKDRPLLYYLQTLDVSATIYEEIEELLEIGFDFQEKIPLYLGICEDKCHGFIKEFSIHIDDLPSGHLYK